MRHLAAIAVFALLPVVNASAGGAARRDIIGNYSVEGDAAERGKKYQGTARIERKEDCYIVNWDIGEGRQRFLGLGIREGDTLSVSILDEQNLSYHAIIVYKIQKDRTLVGRWATMMFDGSRVALGTKTLFETLSPAM